MNINKLYTILLLSAILSFFSCQESGEVSVNKAENQEDIDFTALDIEVLLPAEEGPVRSAFGNPVIEIDTFKLTISGLVDSSFSLGWEHILEFPASRTDTTIMYCVEGWEVWGDWKGILVKDLLNIASVKSNGEYILFESAEGYKTILSISYIEKYNAMLAYEVNGSFLQKHDGFPLRLIAFGKFGYKWSKWVENLTVMSSVQAADPVFEDYIDPANVPLNRRIPYEGNDIKPLEY